MKYGHTTLYGIPVYNFGENNYSDGMALLVFNPNDVTIDQIKAMNNVFLSPLAKPNSLEIFAVYGTEQQYITHKMSQFQASASQQAIKLIGGIPANDDREKWDKLHELEEQILADIKCWYE